MSDAESGHQPKVESARAFSKILEEALDATKLLRANAQQLSADLTHSPPQTIFRAALDLDHTVQQVRPILDRITSIILRANHHTIESAYRSLLGRPDRAVDAERLKQLMIEYHQTRAIVASSSRAIEDAMSVFRRGVWVDHQAVHNDHERELLGKA